MLGAAGYSLIVRWRVDVKQLAMAQDFRLSELSQVQGGGGVI